MIRFAWGLALGAWVVVNWLGPPLLAGAPKPEAESSEPTACIKTVSVVRGPIAQEIEVFGTIVPEPGALQAVSLPFQSQILAVRVSNGQKVGEGETLLQVQPGRDARLQLDQARAAYALQQEAFQAVQRRFDLNLATKEQFLQARQALEKAKLDFESQTERGTGGVIRARASGVVRKVNVQEGAIIAAGQTLIEMVTQSRMEALLGVEPEDFGRVQRGMAVAISRLKASGAPVVSGQVRQLSHAINPTTHLVDLFVSLQSPESFLLDEPVAGSIAIAATDGLTVPRSAVLPEQDRHVVYSVRDGRAVKHFVRIGIENAQRYQIVGGDLQAGDSIVVEGNYELRDGMRVSTESCR